MKLTLEANGKITSVQTQDDELNVEEFRGMFRQLGRAAGFQESTLEAALGEESLDEV